jgi:hypothetical protein
MTRILSPGKCIPEVQEALRENKISLAVAYEISKAVLCEQNECLHTAMLGASREKLAKKRAKDTNGDHVRVNSIRCPLPTGVTVTIRGKELSLADGIEAIGELLKAMRRGAEDGWDSKTFAKVCQDRAKAGGEVLRTQY